MELKKLKIDRELCVALALKIALMASPRVQPAIDSTTYVARFCQGGGVCVSKGGAFMVSGSHARSIRIWDQTQEQVFLEEVLPLIDKNLFLFPLLY